MRPRGMPIPAPMAILWELLDFGAAEDVGDEDVVGDVLGRLVVVEGDSPAVPEGDATAESLLSRKVPIPVVQSQVSSFLQQNSNVPSVAHLVNAASVPFRSSLTFCLDNLTTFRLVFCSPLPQYLGQASDNHDWSVQLPVCHSAP